ncbi:hypothetical protein ACI2KR_31680 [Pseudomonas luteola]
MMPVKIDQLVASELLKLAPMDRSDLPVVNAPQQAFWAAQKIVVGHKGFTYHVGHWGGPQGRYWVVETRTSIIFRGSLQYIKRMIRVCSQCAEQMKACA